MTRYIHIEEKFTENSVLSLKDVRVMSFEKHIVNELAYHPNERPLRALFYEQTDRGSALGGPEIIISYLCCAVVKYVSTYNHKDADVDENVGCLDDFQGKNILKIFFWMRFTLWKIVIHIKIAKYVLFMKKFLYGILK